MNGLERRMTYRVTSEWVGLKRQKIFPSIDFLHPNTFSVDWNHCVLIRLVDSQNPLRADSLEFEFIGDSFRKDSPALAAGARVSSIPEDSLLSLLTPLFPKIFERQTAVICSGCRPWQSSSAIHFHAIVVPFSDNCGALKYALGTLSHTVSKEAVPSEETQTEFLEYCDGGWSPLGELSNPGLIQAA